MPALPGKAPEVVKLEGRASSRKAAAKVCSIPITFSSPVKDPSRTHAAYNLESSPEQSAETEVFKVPARKKEPSKRTVAQKKPLATVTEIFSDDDDDDGNDVDDEYF